MNLRDKVNLSATEATILLLFFSAVWFVAGVVVALVTTGCL